MDPKRLTYADAGVDIEKGNQLVREIKRLAGSTHGPQVLGGIGGFGGCYALDPTGWKEPVLVASTDGVGTKLKVAFMTGNHATVGIDLVAMCANDLAVMGARPLFFLDYYACEALELEVARDVIAGIVEGCRQAGMALLGGETAEMPGMYAGGEYDLAGYALGIIEKTAIIDGRAIAPGDRVLGVGSSGLHSNGFSLARQVIFETLNLGVEDHLEEAGTTVGEELLTPTKIYVESIRAALEAGEIHGMSHITGGGLPENVGRLLPGDLAARLKRDAWEVPAIFTAIARFGEIEPEEMDRTFNMGIGLALILPPDAVSPVSEALEDAGERVWEIGEIVERPMGEPAVEIVE